MKKIMLLMMLVVSVSLCSMPEIFQDTVALQAGVSIIDLGSPDLFLKVESVPQEVRSGKSALLVFELRNKNNFDLKNIKVEAYDKCIFNGKDEMEIETLRENATKTWTWTWNSEDIEIDMDCLIKFRTTYKANNSIYQDIVVLSEGEYQQRELDRTIGQTPIQSSFPESPLQVGLRFSEEQPFMDDLEYYMYLDYLDVGEGYMGLKARNLGISFPKNTKEVSCNGFIGSYEEVEIPTKTGCCYWKPMGCDYKTEEIDTEDECKFEPRGGVFGDWFDDAVCCPYNHRCITKAECELLEEEESEIEAKLVLRKDMTFINKEGSPTTCSFTAKASDPLNIETLEIKYQYEYALDNSMSIRVKK